MGHVLDLMDVVMGTVPRVVAAGSLGNCAGSETCGRGISPMVTSMKSTPGSVPFKHSVVRLYIAALW